MLENTKNYSKTRLVSVKKTESFLKKENISTNSNISFVFKVKPEVRILNLQAKTFASNFHSHGYINLYKILRCRENAVEDCLYKLFIYSYFKCLHNSLFQSNLDAEDDFGYCLKGHSQMFHVLRNTRYANIEGEVYMDISIDLGTTRDRMIQLALLLKQFNFLNSYVNTVSSLGMQAFYIPEFERMLSFLKEDFYAQRADGEPAETGEDYNSESNKLTTSSNGESNTKGRIEIVKVRNNKCKSIMDFKELPITNAFMNEDHTILYYVEVNGNFEVRYNESFFFSSSNFIVISSFKGSTLDDYYRSMNITRNEDFLVASEVYTASGIKCKYVDSSTQSSFKPPFSVGSPEFIQRLIGEYSSRLSSIEEILLAIDELLDLINQEGRDSEPVKKGGPKGK